MEWGGQPLARLEDPEELKRRYGGVPSERLLRWMNAVTGPHREAMAAVLRERGAFGREDPSPLQKSRDTGIMGTNPKQRT